MPLEEMLDHEDICRDQIFLGHYKERRFVPELNDYRDLVVISPAETELIRRLSRFRRKMSRRDDIKWIGIGYPEELKDFPKQHLWVQFNSLPFGHFWFEIKKAHIQNGKVTLKLKCIRELNKEDYRDALMETNMKRNEGISGESENNPSEINLDSLYINNLMRSIESQLTLENFMLVTRFICMTAFVLVAESLRVVSSVGTYAIKLMEMLTRFIEVVTPLLIHLTNCLTKIILSIFYVLLAIINKNRMLQSRDFPATGVGNYPMRQLSYK